jgi:hypothetical protein
MEIVNNTLENVTGCGIPRYNYTDNVEDGSVQAQVVLPDMRAFTGDSAPTREQVGKIKTHFLLLHTLFFEFRDLVHGSPVHNDDLISVLSRILGSHSSGYEKFYLLDYNAA